MIAITGAGGLLGANITADLASRSVPVVAVDRRWLPHLNGVAQEWCDLTDVAAAASLFARWRPSAVIHCAAMTDVDGCEAAPTETWRVNVEMPERLARLAAAMGSQFVYVSTDSVFDGRGGGYEEEDTPAPLNVYAHSKWQGEIAVQREAPKAIVVRTNIYGWNMQPKRSLAEWVLSRLESGQQVLGFADVVFCPILVNDLGDVLLEMLKRNLTGVFHVTGSDACSKYEFARRLAGIFGLDPELVRPGSIDDSVLRAPRPKNTSLVTDRIASVLGRRMPGLDAGISRLQVLRTGGFVERLKAAGREAADACVSHR